MALRYLFQRSFNLRPRVERRYRRRVILHDDTLRTDVDPREKNAIIGYCSLQALDEIGRNLFIMKARILDAHTTRNG